MELEQEMDGLLEKVKSHITIIEHTKEEQGAIEHSQHIRRLKHYDLASHQEEGQHIVPQRISQPTSAGTTIDEELAVVLHPSGAFQRRQLRQGWL